MRACGVTRTGGASREVTSSTGVDRRKERGGGRRKILGKWGSLWHSVLSEEEEDGRTGRRDPSETGQDNERTEPLERRDDRDSVLTNAAQQGPESRKRRLPDSEHPRGRQGGTPESHEAWVQRTRTWVGTSTYWA